MGTYATDWLDHLKSAIAANPDMAAMILFTIGGLAILGSLAALASQRYAATAILVAIWAATAILILTLPPAGNF